MFETIIEPRFCETDALQHISNTTLPIWFEAGRQPIFSAILPSMTMQNWSFMIAHVSVDYLNQIYLGNNVNIKVGIASIGNKSFSVYHEAWQKNGLVATGKAVIVYFDFKTHCTASLPRDVIDKLNILYGRSEYKEQIE